jgi:nickel/cobalt exporter
MKRRLWLVMIFGVGILAAQPRSDYLARLLHEGQISWGMLLTGLAVAFGLGSIHALSPGHGKTIVAAYLVGARGTPQHALLLGAMVTFTHTASVFLLGFSTLFLSHFLLPEKIYPVLGTVSGITILCMGIILFRRRLKAVHQTPRSGAPHPPMDSQRHSQPHADHDHHDHHPHHHHHPHPHQLDEVSLGGLIALGASGGLVPCPSALVLLLSSVALGHVGIGLMLLVAFSAGLALVLSGIGLAVLYAKHLLPDAEHAARGRVFRYLPVASAAVITMVGIVMTGVALGVIRPFLGA